MIDSAKRCGQVMVDVCEGDEPYFDVDFSRARSQGKAQVGVAQPRRILDSSDLTSAHTCPSSSGAVVAAYENGILVGGLRGSLSISVLAWFGFLPACGLIFVGLWCAYVIAQAGAGALDQPGLAIGLTSAGVIGLISGVSIFSVLLRVLVFMLSDFPVLLDRTSKDVWFVVPKMPSFVRIFELYLKMRCISSSA